MQRFLLFDSGCSICSDIAREVEHESNGWLSARSLHDAEMQSLISGTRPNWQWEPTLLEVNKAQVWVSTGWELRLRFILGMGPRRSWRIAQIVRRGIASSGSSDLRRRGFFRQAGTLLAGFLIVGSSPKLRLGDSDENNTPNLQALLGELYAGFVLLIEGAPLPDFVIPSRNGIPIVCGVGFGRGGPKATAVTKNIDTPQNLARMARLPLYTLGKLPDSFRPAGGYQIEHESGEVFGASVNFDSYNAKTENWEGSVGIWAQPDFPHPYPLWSSVPAEPDLPAVILEKVDFLPSRGIMVSTQDGYVFYWIENDVFYTLRAEHNPTRKEIRKLVDSLILVT
jgi:hypothetical protein